MKLQKIPGEYNVVADGLSRHCPVQHPEDTDFEEIHVMEEYNICTLSSPELANLVLDEEQLAEIYEEDILDDDTIAQIFMMPLDNNVEEAPGTALSMDTSTLSETHTADKVARPTVGTPSVDNPPGAYDESILQGRDRIQDLSLTNSSRKTSTQPAVRVQQRLLPRQHLSIPEQYYSMIQQVHNTDVGHFKADAVINKLLRSNKAWPYMREHVTAFVNQCPICQKLSDLRIAISTHPFTLSTTTPMTDLQIDAVGPLTPDKEGHCHIIVIIDRCSRYVTLHAAKDTSAEEAVKAIVSHIAIFGNPSTISSDRGSQFVNDVIMDLNKLTVTEIRTTTAYSKQENSMVERANKEVMRHLRAYVMDAKAIDTWSMWVPLVQRIMNNHVHTTLGCTPSELIVRTTASLAPAIFTANQTQLNVGKWGDKVLALQTRLLHKAMLLQHRIDAANIVKRRPKGTLTEFPIDSYVLLTYPETRMGALPPSKLHAKLRGPFRVRSVEGSAYTLTDLVSHKDLNPVHVSRLREFKFDSEHTDPSKVAQTDNLEFEVERILEHSGDVNKRSTLDFLVRWTGYSEEHDLWLPYSELRNNAVLHSYLTEKGLVKLIPKDSQQSEATSAYTRSRRRE